MKKALCQNPETAEAMPGKEKGLSHERMRFPAPRGGREAAPSIRKDISSAIRCSPSTIFPQLFLSLLPFLESKDDDHEITAMIIQMLDNSPEFPRI